MVNKKVVSILTITTVILVGLYIFVGINSSNFGYFFPRRLTRILGIILVGLTISISTVIFQALTNNKILTPNMLGFDSMYVLSQTTMVFFFGQMSIINTNSQLNFFITLIVMVLLSSVLYGLLFKKMGSQIIAMLMIGIILSTLFRSFSSFLQMIMDPNEFSIIQDRSFASFNNMNTNILWYAVILTFVVFIIISEDLVKLDVVALGKEHAINLGINYDKFSRKQLILISTLIAIATSLVGPIMFLGLLVVNIARVISKTYKHTSLIILSFLISLIFLIGGQLVLERIFNFALPLNIVINFVGGMYMLYLLKKEMTL